jgi:hypothetical protein
MAKIFWLNGASNRLSTLIKVSLRYRQVLISPLAGFLIQVPGAGRLKVKSCPLLAPRFSSAIVRA